MEVIDGAGRAGDEDLILYFEICRRHGETLLGPPPHDIFPPSRRSLLLHMCERELQWIEDNFTRATFESSVLQACRAWCYLEEDMLCSKIAGGEWARDRLKGREKKMVEAARNLKLAVSTPALDPSSVLSFVRRTRAMFFGSDAKKL